MCLLLFLVGSAVGCSYENGDDLSIHMHTHMHTHMHIHTQLTAEERRQLDEAIEHIHTCVYIYIHTHTAHGTRETATR